MDEQRRGWCVVGLGALLLLGCGADAAESGAARETGLENGSQPDGPYGTVALACNPRADNGSCARSYTCCSSDPSTANARPPDFEAQDVSAGAPYFSGANNELGTQGMCVHVESVREELSLTVDGAHGCPIPCNPTWGAAEIAATCGEGVECCQTTPIEPADCVQDDPEDEQSWRPVRGSDLLEGKTGWAPADHRTHQDPGGLGCQLFAAEEVDVDDPGFALCLEALTVADQRGFCGRIAGGCAQDDGPDACEQINMGLIPPPPRG